LPNRRYLELLPPSHKDQPKQESHTGKPREYHNEEPHYLAVHERHIARIAPAKFLALRSHSPVYREPLHHRTNLAFAHKYRTSSANIGYGMKGEIR